MLIAIIIHLISSIPTFLRIMLIISTIAITFVTLYTNADISFEVADDLWTTMFFIPTYIGYYISKKLTNTSFEFFNTELPLSFKFLLVLDAILLILVIIQTASNLNYKRNIIPAILIKLTFVIVPAIILAKFTFFIFVLSVIIAFILSYISSKIHFF